MKRSPYGVARGGVLPEAGAEGNAFLDPDAHLPHLPARKGGSRLVDFPLVNTPEAAALDGADELHRHERLVLARRQAGPAGLRALRPRPAGRRLRACDPRRSPDPRGARGGSSSSPTSRRAAPTGFTCSSRSRAERPIEQTYEFAERVARGLEAAAPGAGHDGVAEAQARGRARRPPSERAREDDRLGLLGAAEAGRAGLDAAALGRADARR